MKEVFYGDQFETKMAALRRGGARDAHLILDFDKTLTHPDGETSWSILRKHPDLSAGFHAATAALFARFHPVEVDPKLSVAERRAAMDEWWNEAHGLLLAERVRRESFAELVEAVEIQYRRGVGEMLALAREKGVPVLVLSAGLGDLIDASLARQADWAHLHCISNHLKFDEKGVGSGFAHANITTFTKNEAQLGLLHPAWEQEMRERRNAIVVGDSVGDAAMADGIAHEVVLRVGYLNPGQESSLAEYRAAFDVVLQNDFSLDFITELLRELKMNDA